MIRNLLVKLRESAFAVIPICLIVLLLHATIAPIREALAMFLSGAALLILGAAAFALGTDMAMTPVGEYIGGKLTASRKFWLVIIGCFVLGVSITVAEPDLQVLTKQVQAVPDWIFILTVAVGVGVMLVVAILRILFQVKLRYVLLALNGILLLLALFTKYEYLAVSFDSGGVTTGPITVPFILALGVGIASIRSGKSAEEDSFGLTGICSIGPIMAVLILGMFFKPDSALGQEEARIITDAGELARLYGSGFLQFGREITIALLPIILFFVISQFVRPRVSKSEMIRIAVGFLYTILGLTVFLTGVNRGFLVAGRAIGMALGSYRHLWVLIPVGFVLGCLIITAEPVFHIMTKQVEDITSGAISKKMMAVSMAGGVGLAVALSLVRIVYDLPIWIFLLVGYGAALALTFVVPGIFTAIAFDSGGIASGVMATTFLLPIAMGISKALGLGEMTAAFGIIAMVALLPPVTVQLMGLWYQVKLRSSDREFLLGEQDLLENADEDLPEEPVDNSTTPG